MALLWLWSAVSGEFVVFLRDGRWRGGDDLWIGERGLCMEIGVAGPALEGGVERGVETGAGWWGETHGARMMWGVGEGCTVGSQGLCARWGVVGLCGWDLVVVAWDGLVVHWADPAAAGFGNG